MLPNGPAPNRPVATLIAGVWLLIAVQILLGTFLAVYYNADLQSAHRSVFQLSGPAKYFASLHYWSSAVTLITAGALLALMLWNGLHRWHTRGHWWTSLGAFAVLLALQITGNLLPASAHDVRTAFIEAQIASQAPVVGDSFKSLTLGGEQVSQTTLDRWYFAHRFLLPALLLAIIVPAMFLQRRRPIGRPIAVLAVIPLGVAAALAANFAAPLGPPAGAEDFASGATRPMWYVLPMHAMLNWFQSLDPSVGWVGSLLLPSLAFLFLFSLPFFSRSGEGPTILGRLVLPLSAIFLVAAYGSFGKALQNPFVEKAFETPLPPVAKTPPIDPVLVKRGHELFLANCTPCHYAKGKGKKKPGGVLDSIGKKRQDPEWFIRFLKDPETQGITTMPSFDDLNESELRALADFLRSLGR